MFLGRILYTVLMKAIVPLFFVRLLYRSLKKPAHLDRWQERFGYIKKPVPTGGVWIHAVSVGETVATVPIVQRLRTEYPTIPIIFSNTTLTGYERTHQLFGTEVMPVYLPYDLPSMVDRFLRTIRPRFGIIMETELWPNLFFRCRHFAIPLIIANARLSQASYAKYRWIRSLIQQVLACTKYVAVQGELDGERFIALGLEQSRLLNMGNIKFDFPRLPNIDKAARCLRDVWGRERLVWVAASTHQGEEEIVLKAFHVLQVEFPSLLLILIPRHPERFSLVAALLEKQGLQYVKRSSQQKLNHNTQVLLGDTMGEMALFYAAADLAFVGGSLVMVGGHNLLEPSVASIPSISGPHIFNFKEISQWLLAADAMKLVQNGSELIQVVRYWLQNPKMRQQAGLRASAVVAEHRGAVDKLFDILYPLLRSRVGDNN